MEWILGYEGLPPSFRGDRALKAAFSEKDEGAVDILLQSERINLDYAYSTALQLRSDWAISYITEWDQQLVRMLHVKLTT